MDSKDGYEVRTFLLSVSAGIGCRLREKREKAGISLYISHCK